MIVDRVEFLRDHRLGTAEMKATYITAPSTSMATHLPVPERPGCEVHMFGDWIVVREVWKDPKKERAGFVVPREQVAHIYPTADQLSQIMKSMVE